MSQSCPVPTPAERAYGEIQSRIENALIQKVHAALQGAAEQAQDELQAAGIEMSPPSEDYFTSVVHQRLYCKLCGTAPGTFQGGRPDTAIVLIRNMQNIARHYWGAKIELSPKP